MSHAKLMTICNEIINTGRIDDFNDLQIFFKEGGLESHIHYYGNTINCGIDKICGHRMNEGIDDKDTFIIVDEQGGENCGLYWHVVIKHIPSNKYLKFSGDYYSYDGYDYDNCIVEEVFPHTVTKIEYK